MILMIISGIGMMIGLGIGDLNLIVVMGVLYISGTIISVNNKKII